MAIVNLSGRVVRAALAVAVMFMAVAPWVRAQTGSGATGPDSDLALARDYVLAACLIQKYPGTALAEEAEVWAEGLVEHGNIDAGIYPDLAEIARNDAPQPLVSRSGKTMLLQSCIQLYNSADLRDKISRLLKK